MKTFTIQEFIGSVDPEKANIIEHYLGFGIERATGAPKHEIKKALFEDLMQKCMIFSELVDETTEINFDSLKVSIGVTNTDAEKRYDVVFNHDGTFEGVVIIKFRPFGVITKYDSQLYYFTETSIERAHKFFDQFQPIRPEIKIAA